jgi:hypothetical protein
VGAAAYFKNLTAAVDDHRPKRALLLANQAVEEAKSVKETIVSHSAQLASVYPGSPFLTHIARRRQAQSAELKVFLADLTRRLTDTTWREISDVSAATSHATAAWFDFLDGWMGTIEKELVRPLTLRQTTDDMSPPVATPPPAAQQGGQAPGASSQAPPNKRQAVGNTPGGSGSGSSSGAGPPASSSSVVPRGRMCVFQRVLCEHRRHDARGHGCATVQAVQPF